MGEDPNQLSLSWDHFGKNLQDTWRHLHQSEEFADVTLACDLGQVMAHRIVLASFSPYLHSILARLRNSQQQPVIFLSTISIANLTKLLTYMYCGEVAVEESQLESFLQAATVLKVKGLVAADNNSSAPDVVSSSSKKVTHDQRIKNLKKVQQVGQEAAPRGIEVQKVADSETSFENSFEKKGLIPSSILKVAMKHKKSCKSTLDSGEIDVAAKDENDVKEEEKEENKVGKQMNSQAAGDNLSSVLESGDAEKVHVICQCGQVKVVRCVRKESANKGRKFFSCPKKLQLCTGSFQWCDEVAEIQSPQAETMDKDRSKEIKTIEIINSNGERIAPATLNLHLQTKFQRLQAGKFQCNECGKILVSRAKIMLHLETHLGLSLPCSLCANSYKTRRSLANHYQTRHAASVNPLNM